MNYRDILGIPKKQPKKKVEKKVAPKPTAPPITKKLKEQFGPLNEWGEVDTGPKRWSGNGLTEFEQQGGKDNVNEGPAYEYAPAIKKIEKLEVEYKKSIDEFAKLLIKKGLRKEAKELVGLSKYVLSPMKKFMELVDREILRKLM